MPHHHPDYEIRYGAPWYEGERAHRYVVHRAPRPRLWWWRISDKWFIRYQRLQLWFDMLLEFLGALFTASLVIYLFFWHCLPVMIDFFLSL